MEIKLKEKLYHNALITERLMKLSNVDKQKIIISLLKNKSERQLADELGIAHSTIHDWKTLRQCNKGSFVHISLSSVYKRLKGLNVTAPNFNDWGRLEQIKNICEELLEKKVK